MKCVPALVLVNFKCQPVERWDRRTHRVLASRITKQLHLYLSCRSERIVAVPRSNGSAQMLQGRDVVHRGRRVPPGACRSMTNLTISEVTLDGQQTLVVALFIPGENDTSEAGELIYYRLITD